MAQDMEQTHNVPRLELEGMIGFNGSVKKGLIIHPDGEHMIYPLGITVIIENLSNHKQHFLMGHSDNVSCLAVCKSGKYLASGQVTHMGFVADIILWDYETKQRHKQLKLHKVAVQALVFSPHDLFLVSLGGQDDGNVVVWDLKTGDAICGASAQLDSAGNALCVEYHHSDDEVFMTGGKKTLRIWKLNVERRVITPTEVQMGQVGRDFKSIQYFQYFDSMKKTTDEYILCGTSTGDILGINMASTRFQFHGPGTKEKNFSCGVTALALAKPGELLVGSGSGEVALLKVCTKKNGITFEKKHSWTDKNSKGTSAGITSITLRGSGHQFYVGTANSQIYRFNYAEFTCELVKSCHSMEVTDIAFPFGSSELIVTSQEGQIRIWHLKSMKELLRQVVANMVCKSLAITRDGKMIITAWSDGKIRGYGIDGKTLVEKFVRNDAHSNGVTAVAVTSDCKYIISGGGEGQVRIWSIDTTYCNGKERCIVNLRETMMEHKGLVSDIKISYDDKKCVSASTDGTTIIWNLQTKTRENIVFANTLFKSVCFGPSELQIVTSGTDRKLAYWDTCTGEMVRDLEGSKSGSINAMDIAPDGVYMVTGGDDKIIKLLTYDQAETIAVGIGHSGAIHKVKICPNQQRIVSVSEDGGILIWKFPIGLEQSMEQLRC